MSFQYPDSRILIFAKAPVAGQVKTRLHPALSPAQCAVLQARLIEHALETCVGSKICPVELWRADNAADDFFHDCAHRFDIALHTQCRGDLGARMYDALEKTLRKASCTIIVGVDCPLLSQDHFHTVMDILHSKSPRAEPVALIPAEDGGYVMVGATKAVASMFNAINWGSTNVMAQTRNRLATNNIKYTELPALWDIDRPEDLARLKTLDVGKRLLDALGHE